MTRPAQVSDRLAGYDRVSCLELTPPTVSVAAPVPIRSGGCCAVAVTTRNPIVALTLVRIFLSSPEAGVQVHRPEASGHVVVVWSVSDWPRSRAAQVRCVPVPYDAVNAKPSGRCSADARRLCRACDAETANRPPCARNAPTPPRPSWKLSEGSKPVR